MKIELLKQYSVSLPNKPGALAELSNRFAEKGVNIVGISSEVRSTSALVHIAIEGNTDHSEIISRAGYASMERELISIQVEDKPGRLCRIAQALGDSGVNITTIYGTGVGGPVSRMILAAENLPQAVKILERIQVG